jgi:50S ribosomal protein L16 3-hydroxylase
MDAETRIMDDSDAARVSSLIHPLPLEQFLTASWPGEFCHFPGNATRLAELMEQPEFRDITSLVNCPQQGMIRADYTHVDRESEAGITPARALQLYNSACTIYMTSLATQVTDRWVRALDNTFGLLPGTTQINAFASLPGRGAYWHWDAQENFIVQVRGRKRWRVAPNEYLEWPTNGGQQGSERMSDIRFQLKDPSRPIEVPKQWRTIELAPGDVLFTPRGYWHSTENIDASLHLVLQMKMPCWRDVFAFLLRSVPQLYSLEWRRPTRALQPQHLLTSGLREFQERQAALASFATPAGIAALARLFGQAKAERSRDIPSV